MTVFAAASLRGALDDIIAKWQAASGAQARVSYAGTSALARQILSGAPANLFISANTLWTDVLVEADALVASSVTPVARNRLVLIADEPVGVDVSTLADALADKRIAMGLLGAVPAGIYGEEALRALSAWETARPGIVEVSNVRVALALVERGESDYAIVYATDAALAATASIVFTFPEGSHAPIVYPAALVSGNDSPLARDLLALLAGPEGRAVLRSYGFLPP